MPSPTDLTGLYAWYDAATGRYDATSGGSSVTADRGAVARWEDQSGNGRHLTQGTSANRPVYDATRGLVVSETYLGADERFACPAGFTLDRQAFSLFLVAEVSSYYAAAQGGGAGDNHFLAGDTDNNNPNLYYGKDGRLSYYNGAFVNGNVTVTVPGNRCLFGWVGSASAVKAWVNGTSYSLTALGSGNVTWESLLGYSAGNGPSQVGCKDLIVYSRALSDSEVTGTLLAYATGSRGVSSPPGARLFFLGDSITHGYGVTVNRTYPQRTALADSFATYVMAKSGAALSDLSSDRAACLDPLLRSGDVAVVFAGTNDIAGGASPATVEGRLWTLCDAVRGGGAKVLVVTCLPRLTAGGDWATYRSLQLANYATHADAVVDAGGDPRLADPTDTTYYLADAIHPNDAGTQVLADLIGPAARSLLVPSSARSLLLGVGG